MGHDRVDAPTQAGGTDLESEAGRGGRKHQLNFLEANPVCNVSGTAVVVADAGMGSDLSATHTNNSKHPLLARADFPWCLLLFSPPGGVAASQCPKEDSRSSGASHETTGTKRTYDMMEGRISRGLSARDTLSTSIEGESGLNL